MIFSFVCWLCFSRIAFPANTNLKNVLKIARTAIYTPSLKNLVKTIVHNATTDHKHHCPVHKHVRHQCFFMLFSLNVWHAGLTDVLFLFCSTGIECAPGRFGRFGNGCQLCPNGWARGEKDDATTCLACGLGKATPNGNGSAFCSTCDLGTYGSDWGLCKNCESGKFSDSRGTTVCKDCPISTYSSVVAATTQAQCIACDKNRTSLVKGANNIESCLCKEKSSYQNDQNLCITCPAGATCPKIGSRLFHLYPQAGFWQHKNITDEFIDCGKAFSDIALAKKARLRCCPGSAKSGNCSHVPREPKWTIDQQCVLGYAGPLCVACAPNVRKTRDVCHVLVSHFLVCSRCVFPFLLFDCFSLSCMPMNAYLAKVAAHFGSGSWVFPGSRFFFFLFLLCC